MTTPQSPKPAPAPASPRSDERALAASVGTSRVIALVAMLIAAVALGLAAWGFLAQDAPDCQQQAWATTPAQADLPAEWEITAQQYDLQRKTMSLLGPIVDDETGAQAVTYATITCFGTDAAESVTLSQQAAVDAGQTVVERPDIGEQAYSSTDDSGSVFLQLRHGPIVIYLAASSDASPQEVDQLASAFDKALGGDGGTIAAATAVPDLSEAPFDSFEPEPSQEAVVESPVVPHLEAALPAVVGDVALVADSATGSSILGDDQGSRAILAALRSEGLDADDLQVARAFDETEATDLAILAMAVEGMDLAKVQDLVLDSWLAASGAGVTRTPVTLGGAEWILLDYGDDGTKDWVRAQDGVVFVIETADAALAEQAAAAIP